MSGQFFKRFAVVVFVVLAASASAEHQWGNYHWESASTPFDITVINSTTDDWDSYVSIAIDDWSLSTVLNMVEDPEGSTSSRVRRQCKGPNGKVRICNLAYGFNGWLGIAGISVDTNGHIISGYTKLNDSYFNSAPYNDAAWKQSVACQELGHNAGLGHQDENFNNISLFSCMDYQDPPTIWPNTHDYEELAAIYGHIHESGGTDPIEEGGGCNAPPGKGCNKSDVPTSNGDIGWGASLGRRGHSETFIRIDPNGTRHITHVLWVSDEGGEHLH